jgi:hypothetical protein
LAGFSPAKSGPPVPPPPPPVPGTTGYLEKLGFRNADLVKLGLKSNPYNFIAWRGQTKPFVFLLYYLRADAGGPQLPPPPAHPPKP